ncbi:conserved hypothetical protein [Ricinus communis]|uniref:FAR1 domain-containing protein n=1 Tax=Ricinus communis TaxID=3988 RepID=B9T7N0_RICCO|nr:conserved hypothetical protein [Ricinus communis]
MTISCDRSRKAKYEKSLKRIDCPARVNAIKKALGVWAVSKINRNHNHDLQPDMSILMAGHRKISIHMKRQLEVNDITSVRPGKNVKMLEIQAGGQRI